MMLKGDKKGLVTIIMKKMKGHGDMSPSFKSESAQQAKTQDGVEQDQSSAEDKCCSEMIQALKSGDSKQLKSSLKSFIQMVVQDAESDEQE
jgi:hypothetical protein